MVDFFGYLEWGLEIIVGIYGFYCDFKDFCLWWYFCFIFRCIIVCVFYYIIICFYKGYRIFVYLYLWGVRCISLCDLFYLLFFLYYVGYGK